MKIWLDDIRPAPEGYVWCKSVNIAKRTLTALMDAVMKDEDIHSDCYIRHQEEGIDIICSNIGLARYRSTVGKCNEQGICIETDFIWYQGSI